MIAHVSVIGLVSYGILHSPPPVRVMTERYTFRQIDLHMPDLPRPVPAKPSRAALETANAIKSALNTHSAQMRQVFRATLGRQTLLQPDQPIRLANLEELPLPQIHIWTPPKPVVKTIVAPKPTPPTTADVQPSIAKPSAEVNLADIDISASKLPSQKLTLLPSTTTPIVTTQTLNTVRLTPSTTSQRTDEPTPTAVLSMSDLIAKDGPVILPPVNTVVRLSPDGLPNGSTGAELAGQDKQSRSTNDTGSGHGSGNLNGVANSSGAKGTSNVGQTASLDNLNSGNLANIQSSTTRISLAPNGHFGSVIVGQNLEDQFPELANIMSGRMEYTVYLHVGVARSWILKYSLPRSADAATAGNANRLDAPWPYTIIRPNLTADQVNADALMIHGFVNAAGHFENLSMAFPKDCSQATFILRSLEQWQFRPASQNGQVTRVEILLIIPEDYE